MPTLLPLLDDTIGPYFPPAFAASSHLDLYRQHLGLNATARGVPIRLLVRLLDIAGGPATGAVLEVWQPNVDGLLRIPGNESQLFDDPYFQGYGRVHSQDGRFAITTVKPGASQYPGGRRAPFITLTIFSDGISRIVTQIFLEGEDLNEQDPVLLSVEPELRGRLIANRQPSDDGVATYAIEIRMRGEGETPFFDDLIDATSEEKQS